MNKFLPVFIGLRYLRSRQEDRYFSLVSIFSFAAMTLGVAALIIVLSVMNGFDREIKTRILNVVPHLTIVYDKPHNDWLADAKKLSTTPEILDIAPYIEGQGMLSAMGRVEAVSLQGVDPQSAAILEPLEGNMLSGGFSNLQVGEFGVVIGSLLARSLNLVTGDEVLLTLPQVMLTPVGIFPRVKVLKVVGIYQVGAQVDTGIAFVHLKDAQQMFRLGGRVEGLRLRVADPFHMDHLSRDLTGIFGAQARLESWQDSMKTLFAAIKMEKLVVGLLLGVIIAVAGFNIVASLVLMVANKRKDIAVLRAMGASSAAIAAIFRVQGSVAGMSGVALGAILGCLLSWKLGQVVHFFENLFAVNLFDPQIYFISQLPADLQLVDVLVITGFAVVISLVATLYPAYRAGQVSPAEVLRYEH